MTMLLSLMLAAAPVAAAAPPMPQDLGSVPVIEGWLGRKVSPRWSEEVARLYRHGECSGAVNHEGSWLLEIDMLFLLSPEGKPLKIAPVNANCPDVEQFVSRRILGTLSHSFRPGRSSAVVEPVMADGRPLGTVRSTSGDISPATPVWKRSQVRFLWSDAP
ncbi:MAG TPA: hypothetical protein DCG90_06140 [Sphingobium sp.]|uniref:hypothetical protein n=1 Tax=Sphingobium sp. TaxID=1912891 RepID=UPI000EE91C10|nr:hypothetical protein [Sphingobium sp.]HAF41335.1 hypothetical protein [Sphingobium sp.]